MYERKKCVTATERELEEREEGHNRMDSWQGEVGGEDTGIKQQEERREYIGGRGNWSGASFIWRVIWLARLSKETGFHQEKGAPIVYISYFPLEQCSNQCSFSITVSQILYCNRDLFLCFSSFSVIISQFFYS